MSSDRLNEFLRTMADEVTPVPMAEAALAHSRRTTVRRTVGGLVAVVVLLVTGGVGIASLSNEQGVDPVPPAESRSASPSPDASDSGSREASAPPVADGKPKGLGGATIYYVDGLGQSNQRVLRWTEGSAPEVVLEGDGNLIGSATVSPDGRYLSWVSDANKLMLRDLNSGKDRTLMDYPDAATGGMCQEPTWTADSKRIVIRPDTAFGVYEIASKKFTELSHQEGFGCHVRLDGERFVSLSGGVDSLSTFDLNGRIIDTYSNDLRNGTKVIDFGPGVIGEPFCMVSSKQTLGDIGRGIACDSLVVVENGKLTPIRTGVSWATVTPDGYQVVREVKDGKTRWVGYDDNDKQLWTTSEEKSLSKAYVLALIPAG